MSFPFLGIAFVYLHKYNRYITFLKFFTKRDIFNLKSQRRKSTGSYIINNSLNGISFDRHMDKVGILLYSKLINFMFFGDARNHSDI